MKFEELVGNGAVYDFYGVDNTRFRIGGMTLEAIEDPNDGYRSYLDSIVVRDDSDCIFFHHPIARVKIEEAEQGQWNSFSGYALVDADDGHVWLRIGTDNYDDYYPCFTFEYKPKE